MAGIIPYPRNLDELIHQNSFIRSRRCPSRICLKMSGRVNLYLDPWTPGCQWLSPCLTGGKIKRGIYHIQNVNQLHQSIKGFLRPFHGVATKYLRNYMVWHKVFQFRIGDRMPLREAEEALLLHSVSSRTREISARPAIPITSTRQAPNLSEVMKLMVEKEELARRKLKKNQKEQGSPQEAIPPVLESVPF